MLSFSYLFFLEPWALSHEILDDALMAISGDSKSPAILEIEPENGKF
jgi:hypothetical protein